MAYWDTVIQTNIYQQAVKPNEINAYAAHYPIYEQQTPQYPVPSPYTLANEGYRSNELVYACIQKRLDALSEAPMRVYSDIGETPTELENSPLRELIEAPCEGVTEKLFWKINELYGLTNGYAAWEKERNRLGDIIHLWPMRADWCSFYRGDGRPIRAVRYQPYGLPPIDIPRENVLLFMDFDPIFPLLKGLGAVQIARRSISVDNAATDYLKVFFQQGSVIAGLLSTDQSLQDMEADRIRARWKDVHGGVGNWGDIAVLGKGTKYQQMGMNFRDMAFDQLDGRDEARICAVLKVPPILVGAKVGLTASTYSNYEQARKAFYEETVSSQWANYQDEIKIQLLPELSASPDTEYVEFDTSKVRALQENRDASWKRAIEGAKSNVITRDESRKEMGLDPIDNLPVFVGVTVRAMDQASIGPGGAPEPSVTEIAGSQPQDQAASEADMAAQSMEMKQFRAFAAKRRKEGKPEKAKEFKFKYLPAGKQAALLTELPGSVWRNYP